MTAVDDRPGTALVTVPAPRLPAAGERVPVVVPGVVVFRWPPSCPWAITDPVEIAGIQARVRYHSRPWPRRFVLRLLGRRPREPWHLHRWTRDEMAAGRRDDWRAA